MALARRGERRDPSRDLRRARRRRPGRRSPLPYGRALRLVREELPPVPALPRAHGARGRGFPLPLSLHLPDGEAAPSRSPPPWASCRRRLLRPRGLRAPAIVRSGARDRGRLEESGDSGGRGAPRLRSRRAARLDERTCAALGKTIVSHAIAGSRGAAALSRGVPDAARERRRALRGKSDRAQRARPELLPAERTPSRLRSGDARAGARRGRDRHRLRARSGASRSGSTGRLFWRMGRGNGSGERMRRRRSSS
jgi:hypothetical protein